MSLKIALTIAGSDPSGGAGIQADLKTFHQRKVYGMSVITLVTVQNTRTMSKVSFLDPELVTGQLQTVLDDLTPDAAKIGALGSAAVIRAVAKAARKFTFPLVVDPVMISKHGMFLMQKDAVKIFVTDLLPHADLLIPNVQEAGVLSGRPVRNEKEMREAARALKDLGAEAILIKGGHLRGDALDLLYWRDRFHVFRAPRIRTVHTHGTGCTYSAVITAEVAKGADWPRAIHTAKRFITRAIETSPKLGGGCGPVNHHAKID